MRNILSIWKLTAGAGFALALQTGISAAGERGCFWDCYEQEPARVIHRTFLRRVEIERGAYEIDREPSFYGIATRRVLLDDDANWHDSYAGARRSGTRYGYVRKRILLRPYKNIAIYHRARHRYVREHVAIQPEGYVWQPASGGPAYRY
jgi:hypothetical protein